MPFYGPIPQPYPMFVAACTWLRARACVHVCCTRRVHLTGLKSEYFCLTGQSPVVVVAVTDHMKICKFRSLADQSVDPYTQGRKTWTSREWGHLQMGSFSSRSFCHNRCDYYKCEAGIACIACPERSSTQGSTPMPRLPLPAANLSVP